jgi:hypothetical protein
MGGLPALRNQAVNPPAECRGISCADAVRPPGRISPPFSERFVPITIKLRLDHLILSVGIVFLVLQLLEEGVFNFAAWVGSRWTIPDFTITSWLLLQPYFILALSFAYFIYRTDPDKFLAVGVGIVVWGLLDFLGFAGISWIYEEYTPGLISSLIYLPIAFLAYRTLRREGKVSWGLGVRSSLAGILIMTLPILAFLGVDRLFGT